MEFIQPTGAASVVRHGICVSLGVIAWNEETAIVHTLRSVLAQSLFGNLKRRGLRCEFFCVPNGCTDATAAVALELFRQMAASHPAAEAILFHVAELRERGKYNAWNEFVHRLSSPEAKYLFLLDADILIHEPETLWSMLQTLEQDPQASIAVDRPCKNISFKTAKSPRERLSLTASRLTQSEPAQLCGQLYCIRSEVARKIYLPKELAACEDGFIKAMVCTDFGSHEVLPQRIRLAPEAAHTFEPYTSLGAIFRNQKRQVIGQTMVHVLVDQHIKTLPPLDRTNLAETLRKQDREDPGWLTRLLGEHLRQVRWPWQLYPGLAAQRFKGLRRLPGSQLLSALPSAIAGFFAILAASVAARHALARGASNYWPKAQRAGFGLAHTQPDPGTRKLQSNDSTGLLCATSKDCN